MRLKTTHESVISKIITKIGACPQFKVQRNQSSIILNTPQFDSNISPYELNFQEIKV